MLKFLKAYFPKFIKEDICQVLKFQFSYHIFSVIRRIVYPSEQPGHVAQSVGHLTRKSGVLGSIPGLATYFRFSFCFFKKGSCQLLAKARSTG